MFKRFVIGLLVGMAGMHWYIHSSEPVLRQIQDWLHGKASLYSDEKTREVLDDLFGSGTEP
ncbi:MAG: hypothetical protein KatS3mg076_0561 [Candidatus Binatia bacterium]|nr:MAG: hypothetical protein KatS3mg076_0561 [Candidatus Binatia bacterium]